MACVRLENPAPNGVCTGRTRRTKNNAWTGLADFVPPGPRFSNQPWPQEPLCILSQTNVLAASQAFAQAATHAKLVCHNVTDIPKAAAEHIRLSRGDLADSQGQVCDELALKPLELLPGERQFGPKFVTALKSASDDR